MDNSFAVILRDKNYIVVTHDESLNIDTDIKKMDFVVSEFEVINMDIELIESIKSVDEAKANSELKLIQWCNNQFIIFLKDESFIKMETGSHKPMTLESKSEFAIKELKKLGKNPDLFSHIGDESELKIKTNLLLASWVIGAILIVTLVYVFFIK